MSKQPNIVFIFSDQQHWQALGFEDSGFETPNLDRLARQATVFTHAFCSTPQCGPSRSSIVTGLWPHRTGVIGNLEKAGGAPLQMPTIGKHLQSAGYTTAWFGKWHLGDDPIGTSGWDEENGISKKNLNDAQTTANSIDFLERHAQDANPFALFVSINDPHDICNFPREEDPNPGQDIDLPKTWHEQDFSSVPSIQKQFLDEDRGRLMAGDDVEHWKRYRRTYREKVRLFDDCVGHILDKLETLDISGDCLIVVTSDHGDMDTQHHLILKGPFMYEHLLRIPLIVKPPAAHRHDGSAPPRIDFPTVNIDLAPTLADFAGTSLPAADGLSLKPLLTGSGTPPQREFVISQFYSKNKWVAPGRAIRNTHHKYIHWLSNGEELYDLLHDPDELNNLAADPDKGEIKAGLHTALDQWIADNEDPFYSQQATDRNGAPYTDNRTPLHR